MTEPEIWITMAISGLVTFGIRLSFIVVLGQMNVPDTMRRALRYVPAAVLSAIIIPEMFLTDKQLNISLGNFRLLAGLLAALVAWRTKNILLTIAVGMGALWLLQTIF